MSWAARSHAAMEHAAFKLFAKQAEDYDIVEAAARLEWETDPELRTFWLGQVTTVIEALTESLASVGEPVT